MPGQTDPEAPDIAKLARLSDVKGLLAALAEADPQTRLRAAEALGRLRRAEAVAPLQALLKQTEAPEARLRLLLALLRLSDPSVVEEALTLLVEERSSRVWRPLGQALREHREADAYEALLPDYYRARLGYSAELPRILQAYGRLGDSRAKDLLREHLDRGPYRPNAAIALGRIGGEPALAALLKALADNHGAATTLTVVRAMGRIGDPRALPALERLRKGLPVEPSAELRGDQPKAAPAPEAPSSEQKAEPGGEGGAKDAAAIELRQAVERALEACRRV